MDTAYKTAGGDTEDKKEGPLVMENDPGMIEKMQEAKEKDKKEEEAIKKQLEPL